MDFLLKNKHCSRDSPIHLNIAVAKTKKTSVNSIIFCCCRRISLYFNYLLSAHTRSMYSKDEVIFTPEHDSIWAASSSNCIHSLFFAHFFVPITRRRQQPTDDTTKILVQMLLFYSFRLYQNKEEKKQSLPREILSCFVFLSKMNSCFRAVQKITLDSMQTIWKKLK